MLSTLYRALQSTPRAPICLTSSFNTRADFTFTGKASHAAASPHLGRSALDAVLHASALGGAAAAGDAGAEAAMDA